MRCQSYRGKATYLAHKLLAEPLRRYWLEGLVTRDCHPQPYQRQTQLRRDINTALALWLIRGAVLVVGRLDHLLDLPPQAIFDHLLLPKLGGSQELSQHNIPHLHLPDGLEVRDLEPDLVLIDLEDADRFLLRLGLAQGGGDGGARLIDRTLAGL